MKEFFCLMSLAAHCFNEYNANFETNRTPNLGHTFITTRVCATE